MSDDAHATLNGRRRPGVPIPLAPAQRWFLAQDPVDPNRYNQSIALRFRAPVSLRFVRGALQHVTAAHDAFGLRFRRSPAGQWLQFATGDVDMPVETADL